MDEGDADAGGGVEEEGVEAEGVDVGLCQTMCPHSAPSQDQKSLVTASCSIFTIIMLWRLCIFSYFIMRIYSLFWQPSDDQLIDLGHTSQLGIENKTNKLELGKKQF